MTAIELETARLHAAQTISEIRRHGGLLLRIVSGDQWRLRLYNGDRVPIALKHRLTELSKVTMVLLRELVSDAASDSSE